MTNTHEYDPTKDTLNYDPRLEDDYYDPRESARADWFFPSEDPRWKLVPTIERVTEENPHGDEWFFVEAEVTVNERPMDREDPVDVLPYPSSVSGYVVALEVTFENEHGNRALYGMQLNGPHMRSSFELWAN